MMKKKINANSYLDFYGNNRSIVDKISIENISINALFNYYLILPDTNQFHVSLLGGLGSTVYNKWFINLLNDSQNNFLEGITNFNPYYIFGVSGGTEKIRLSIRYNNHFGNILKDTSVHSTPDTNNSTDERYLNGKMSFLSIGLIYYFTNFLDNE